MGTIKVKHPAPDYLSAVRPDPAEEFANAVDRVRARRARYGRRRALLTLRSRKDSAAKKS